MTARPSPAARDSSRFVLKNAGILLLAQVLVTPLAVLLSALLAQKLGPAAFGQLYLANTFVGFGFLFVEWGQGAVLVAGSAQDRASAGAMLGTSLAFRLAAAAAVTLVLVWLASRAQPEDHAFPAILTLVAAVTTFASLSLACQDVFRGFERIDFAAASYVAFQGLITLVLCVVLLAGGQLVQVLSAQLACNVLGLGVLIFALRPLGVTRLKLTRAALSRLLAQGTPFLGLGVSLALQPNIDAWFLAAAASPEAIGWHAGAKKLVGVLVFPASAIVSGLYPTLCRLYANDREQYRRTARAALVSVGLLVTPLALGCALYPELGVWMLGRDAFRPAEDNLRVLAAFVALTYFCMPLGSCLASAGRTRAWSIAQLGCVAISALLDPPLIRYFQREHGNGGLGVCIATVVSEVAMLAIALALVPKGVLDRSLGRRLVLALCAGGAMTAVAWGLAGLTPWVAAPLALAAYGLCLHGIGGIAKEEERVVIGYLKRKLRLG